MGYSHLDNTHHEGWHVEHDGVHLGEEWHQDEHGRWRNAHEPHIAWVQDAHGGWHQETHQEGWEHEENGEIVWDWRRTSQNDGEVTGIEKKPALTAKEEKKLQKKQTKEALAVAKEEEKALKK